MRGYIAAIGLGALAACSNSGSDATAPTGPPSQPPTSQPQSAGVDIASSAYYIEPNFGSKGA
ncbi:MAG TPA: hypothetical protein VFS33_01270, partial [Gemmatimonadales bacterium]|nr:hypothetical protein [Gemmatimonadales bacterium]